MNADDRATDQARRPQGSDAMPRADAAADVARFHRLLGRRRTRINYAREDFADYLLMLGLCALVVTSVYGAGAWLSWVGLALCGFMAVSFVVRHGAAWRVPVLLRRPQDVLYMLLHKLENVPAVYWAALVVAALENAVIAWTPDWPHHSDLMRQAGLGLFYLHLAVITAYRSYSLVDHWKRHAVVSEVLLQSPWKNAGLVRRNIRYEIVHAYATGLLTHLVLVAPWYFVLTHLQFSVLLLPLACAANVFMHVHFLRRINAWFYRDHWLGHNSELEFVYLHGSHHDAIPVGLIAVAGNGFLEGLMRNTLAYPTPVYHPLTAFLAYTLEIQRDIEFHQFVPGIFPRLRLEFRQVGQHSIHHFGHLEPYGFGVKLDQPGLSPDFVRLFGGMPDEFSNSARLDERLNGFEWNNARYQWFVDLCRKYE